MTQPTISVITVTYNVENLLEGTIKSVLKQTYKNIEYIIIDGNSTDKTLDIIKKYQHEISSWVSEPDKGIYDAMNKGTQKATGDWIIYMNAGDCFFNANVLYNIFGKKDVDFKQFSFIYGNVNAVYKNSSILYPPKKINTFWQGKPFHHQAVFSKSSVSKSRAFSLNFPICADHDFAYYFYNLGHKFLYVDVIIATIDKENGSTNGDYHKLFRENLAVVKLHSKNKFNYFFHYLMYIRAFLTKTVLPDFLVKKVREFTYKKR